MFFLKSNNKFLPVAMALSYFPHSHQSGQCCSIAEIPNSVLSSNALRLPESNSINTPLPPHNISISIFFNRFPMPEGYFVSAYGSFLPRAFWTVVIAPAACQTEWGKPYYQTVVEMVRRAIQKFQCKRSFVFGVLTVLL